MCYKANADFKQRNVIYNGITTFHPYHVVFSNWNVLVPTHHGVYLELYGNRMPSNGRVVNAKTGVMCAPISMMFAKLRAT